MNTFQQGYAMAEKSQVYKSCGNKYWSSSPTKSRASISPTCKRCKTCKQRCTWQPVWSHNTWSVTLLVSFQWDLKCPPAEVIVLFMSILLEGRFNYSCTPTSKHASSHRTWTHVTKESLPKWYAMKAHSCGQKNCQSRKQIKVYNVYSSTWKQLLHVQNPSTHQICNAYQSVIASV